MLVTTREGDPQRVLGIRFLRLPGRRTLSTKRCALQASEKWIGLNKLARTGSVGEQRPGGVLSLRQREATRTLSMKNGLTHGLVNLLSSIFHACLCLLQGGQLASQLDSV